MMNQPQPHPHQASSTPFEESPMFSASLKFPVVRLDANNAAFSQVAGSVPLNDSLGRGANAQLILIDDSTLIKAYSRCSPQEAHFQAENELYVLAHLEDTSLKAGLTRSIGPIVDRDRGVVGVCLYAGRDGVSHPSVQIERLPGNGMSLGDYVAAYTKGEIEYEPLAAIFHATHETVSDLHEIAGVVHGDLHADNILISYNDNAWRAHIIDVAQAIVLDDEQQELAMFHQYGDYGISLINSASIELDKKRLSSEILSEWGGNQSVTSLVKNFL